MIKSIFLLYGVVWISLFLHELAHYAFVRFNGFKNVGFKIGDVLFAIKIGNISVSPVIDGGYTRVDREELKKKGKAFVILFYMSGSITNLLLIIVALLFIHDDIIKDCFIYANVCIIITNLFPIFIKNDFYLMRKSLQAF